MPGRKMSTSAASGGSSRASTSALSPDSAATTSKPWNESTSQSRRRLFSSSSTTSTRLRMGEARLAREARGEGRAAPRLARDGERTAVQLHQAAGEREAQARAFVRRPRAQLVEFAEQVVEVGGGDAHA